MTTPSEYRGAIPRPSRRRRDRHGSGVRGTITPSTVPISASRAQRFDEIVIAAIERIEGAFPELGEVEVLIEEVPPEELRDGSPDPIPLGRVTTSVGARPAQLIVHRRPIEIRTVLGSQRDDLVNDTVTELVAALYGLSPSQIDPDYGQ
ncbi:MAG: metallopeptidase family protein [Actinobacteria bacterium]|nr:metallopeptidase family protein [Actinomycetota bacterium]